MYYCTYSIIASNATKLCFRRNVIVFFAERILYFCRDVNEGRRGREKKERGDERAEEVEGERERDERREDRGWNEGERERERREGSRERERETRGREREDLAFIVGRLTSRLCFVKTPIQSSLYMRTLIYTN